MTDRDPATSPPSHPAAPFHSILFDQPHNGAKLTARDELSYFGDLNLDQVLAKMTGGREEYNLEPFFYCPLHNGEAVEYRHSVLRDLENDQVFAAIDAFGVRMRKMRKRLSQKLYHQYQKEYRLLDAVGIYCTAVGSLTSDLAGLDLDSHGLKAFRDYLTGYTTSDGFTSMRSQLRQVKRDLAATKYCLHILGNRVRVAPYEEEADYSAEVEATFAKFQQGDVRDHLSEIQDWPDMNHVEEQILERVARLHPGVFAAMDDYCLRHRDYLDPKVDAFDREVQFYLGYLHLIRPLKAAGLRFCYPQVSTRSKHERAVAAFDLALAIKLVADRTTVVCNDFHLDDPQRMFVVTGPNQGGKTTFARMFGQLHHLASLGLPVPGREARLFLPDQVHTHFEREEDLQTLRGKLEDELTRIHDILRHATGDSLLVMNETFTSTTLEDALTLGTAVMEQIVELGLLAVYVTFVDELAALSDTVVSMVAAITPGDPASRTFKIERRPADGLAYAAALADKYGLTYQTLRRRTAS
jgi:DNA mismatch repair protein MutS